MVVSMQWDGFCKTLAHSMYLLSFPGAIEPITKAIAWPFLAEAFRHWQGLISKSYKLFNLFLRMYLFNIPTKMLP